MKCKTKTAFGGLCFIAFYQFCLSYSTNGNFAAFGSKTGCPRIARKLVKIAFF